MPPLTTVIVIEPPELLFGIDSAFLDPSPLFHGFKNVPDGPHIVHWGSPDLGPRSAHWFLAKDQDLVVLHWDKQSELMSVVSPDSLDFSAARARLGTIYRYLVDYQAPGFRLDYVGADTLAKVPEIVGSTTTSQEEHELLSKALGEQKGENEQDKQTKGNKQNKQDSKDLLALTPISKQTWRPGATGAARTRDILDQSWYLSQTFGSLRSLLGEMELCFTLVLVLANYSAAQQWSRLVCIMLNSKSALQSYGKRFFALLSRQILQCPPDYIQMLNDDNRLAKALQRCEVEDGSLQKIREVFGVQDDPDDLPVVVVT